MKRGKRALNDLDNDIRDHIERATHENIDRGMAPEEARREALLKFGNVALVKEDTRGVWVSRRLEEIRQDAWYALRTLRRNGVATIVGVLVMALGIGANTAVFSVVDAVLLHPLPYANPDRIVTLTYLSTSANASGDRSRQVSVPDFLDWQAQSTSFDAMAYYTRARTSVMARSVAEYAVVATVTEEFFRVFAAQPSIGRSFSHDEGREGGTGAAMVSDRYARQAFGEPAQAIGRTLRLFNRSVPIVGVLPPAFDYPLDTEVWFTAIGSRAQLHRRGNNFRAIARLKADVTLERAQAELTPISERLEAQYPDTNKDIRVIATPLQREMVGDVASMLYLLLGAVALVLLIACATMATLLLAKATARAPEIAIRAAPGLSGNCSSRLPFRRFWRQRLA
jgi:MacB-like periplasmic core domain